MRVWNGVREDGGCAQECEQRAGDCSDEDRSRAKDVASKHGAVLSEVRSPSTRAAPGFRRASRGNGTLEHVAKSSIAVLLGCGSGSGAALELGRRLRQFRQERRLTQTQAGFPLTKSYVSAVERGVTLPSLGALLLLAERLDVGADVLIRGVNIRATTAYTPRHGDAKTEGHLRDHENERGLRPGDEPGRPRGVGTLDR